jgi:hypothetical protein
MIWCVVMGKKCVAVARKKHVIGGARIFAAVGAG